MRIAAALIALTCGGAVHAAATDFSAGSWIIPMDACYQPSQSFNGSSFSGTTLTSTYYTSGCPDTSSATAKDGVLKAYGLIYRLLQNGITVYYVLNQNKTTVDDSDLTITNNAGTPVAVVNHSTGALTEFMNASHKSISYRGAPFIISAGDTAKALNLLKNDSNFTFTDSRTGRVVFRDVYIHQAKVNITQAPVRAILQQVPPKIALLDIGGAAIGVLEGYLKDAGLNTSGSTKYYPTIGEVFTAFGNVTDFTTSDGLNVGGFKILWAPHWNGGSNTSQRDGVIQKISAFVDAGNPFFAQCAALATMEGADSVTSTGDASTSSYGHFQIDTSGSNVGLKTNQLSPPFPSAAGDKIVVNPSATVKAWINPLAQTGDFNLVSTSNSFTFDFTPNTGYSYRPYVQSLLQSKSNTASKNGLQIASVAYKDGDPAKGQIIYLGGHSYGSQGSTCTTTCSTFNQSNQVGLERLILNTLIFLGQEPIETELTRSAPIAFSDGSTFLGTYVQQTQAAAAFPPWRGHFRKYPPGALTSTVVTAFASPAPTWDGATTVAAAASTDSRVIFTALPVNGKLTQTDFTTANLTALQAVVPSLTASAITSIRKGGMGGVDHSIPAVIGTSEIAAPSRPTVAYVGALDGMLHAFLVSGTVSGKSPGDELWAFIPPSQLAKVLSQSGGVDGSASVGDALVDTGDGNGMKWHTLLGISDGNYTGGTIDVIDITDPKNPRYLWTGSDSVTVSGKTWVMGRAQGAAISPILTGSGLRFAYFLATDNTNGTAGNGFNLYALDAGNGSVIWRAHYLYTNDTAHNDVPGTVAVIDATGSDGPATKVFFGDLEGKVWSVDAVTGALGSPIYDAAAANGASGSIDYPIESGLVLYRDPSNSNLTLLGVTGGADWVDPNVISHVFKVDTKTNTGTNLLDLAAGERVYAVPTIYGNSAYIITSKGNLQGATGTDFNAEGALIRINLGAAGGSATLATVKQGASEVAIDKDGNVIAASTQGITQNANTGKDTSQAVVALQNQAAKRLTVRAWLDLH